MRKLAIAVGLLLSLSFITPAQATDLKVACTAPTTRTDSTAITGVLTFNLYGSLQGQPRVKLVTGATVCSFTRTAVAFGVQEYQATAIETIGGIVSPESALSVTASATVGPAAPNPPTNTTVVTLLAYEMRGSAATKDLRMVSVGVMPEGTPCMQTSATVSGVTYQQVDKKAVDLYSAPAKVPPVMWGRCA